MFKRDRLTWLAYFSLAFFAYGEAILGPLLPFLRGELDLSYTAGGLHASAFALGMVAAGLSADRLSRRWGRRALFWGGAAGLAAGAVTLGLAGRLLFTFSSVLLMGFMGTLLLAMIQAALSDRHGPLRAVALTEANVAASVSAMLAPLLVGAMQLLGAGWRAALYLMPGAVLILAAIWRSVRLPVVEVQAAGLDRTRRQLPNVFWAYWLVVMLGVAVEWTLVYWGVDYLQTVGGFGRADAALLFSLFFLAMVLGRLTGSRLARVMAASTLLALTIALALAAFPLLWWPGLPALNVAGLFVVGLGLANLYPLGLSVAAGTAPELADAASARMTLAGGLSILLAPLAVGWLADRVGLLTALGAAAGLLATALLVVVATNRRLGRRAPVAAG